jgi:hypothetical protein
MVSWDLADGYHHVAVHPDSRGLLGVEWRGRFYQYTTLNFGLAQAPWVFAKAMRAVVRRWRSRQERVFNYLDDFLGAAKCRVELARLAWLWRAEMWELGLVWEPSKCVWIPTQRLELLGLVVDTERMVVEIPEAKLGAYAEILTRILEADQEGRTVSARWLAQAAGKIVSVAAAFSPARLMTRAAFGVIQPRARERWEWDSAVTLSEQVKDDLHWLRLNLRAHNGRQAWRPASVVALETDASHMGCGGWVVGDEESRFRVAWTLSLVRELGLSHINAMELAGVLFALRSLGPWCQGRSLEFHLDSVVAISYLRKGGGRVANQCHPQLMGILRLIFVEALRLDCTLLDPVWVPGVLNVVADEESREVDPHDWRVSAEVFLDLDEMWGPHTVDRMADYGNAQLDRFNSRRWCPGAEAVNCFTQDWSVGRSWVVPAAAMVGRVLAIVAEQRAAATIVLPEWQSQWWWPLLLALQVDVREVPTVAFVAGPSGHVEPKKASWRYLACSLDGAKEGL